ncbi:MAG: fructose-bisphosphatase class III [Kofleriaceae bacterium]|nr:fructose-bisphosphatase class III [Kofleriaceae bacterium]
MANPGEETHDHTVYLRALARRYPNPAAVLAELTNLESILTLPKPTVHVVSDVHGEHVKLRQVVNNASGSLRPLLARLFGDRLDAGELDDLLTMLYYPRETYQALPDGEPRRAAVRRFVGHAVTVIRELARRYTLKHVERIVPDPFDATVRELLFGGELAREPAFLDGLIAPFFRHDRDLELVRMVARIVRNLSVGELVVAGDLGDRGPRLDRVIEILEQQPSVAITWGNHDASWMAACLGHPAAIATVVRLSLRYQRLGQLEEGYGISLAPLERLARDVYGDDPASRFEVKGEPAGDPRLLARMHKAIAIIQFKLDGALFRRHPAWELEGRDLLRRIDPATMTVDVDGQRHPLLDDRWPTLTWDDPDALSADEQRCLDELRRGFVASSTLWRQMSFVASHGKMMLRRDRCAIFHGCVPVDADGALLPLVVDGAPRRGKALFDALEVVVQRAFRKRRPDDLDTLYYLWTGPRSPCFGKDRMATFEGHFVADPATHHETKNPYFALLHDAGFCDRILRELGVDDPAGFIVNGHVPVKLDAGETPVKRSGRAVTIDGAFSAAYGDKGFSLVLDATRMYLAQHYHFDGAAAAVATGADIIPTVADLEIYPRPRTVADTERGDELRAEIAALEELIAAFETNLIRPA